MRFEVVPYDEGAYVYSLRALRGSSERLGACDVCGQWCQEVAYQVEGRTYREDGGSMHITFLECTDLFGHEACLVEKRRA